MKKILFVIPPALPFDEIAECKIGGYIPYIPTSLPLGVLSMSAMLKSQNVGVEILDFNTILAKRTEFGEFESVFIGEVSKLANRFQPDVIAIAAIFNSNFGYLRLIAERSQHIYPQALIVAGGGLPSNLYLEVLAEAPAIAAICYGEGELPLAELLNTEDTASYLEKKEYWITREKVLAGGFSPKLHLLEDLDQIPKFSYEAISFADYQIHSRGHVGTVAGNRASVMTSRGCPFSCCFCASHTIHGKKVRFHSAQRVIDDITYLSLLHN